MPDRDLRTLTDAGVFADIDRYFGESMIDLGATSEIALSAAMVSAMYRAGHTCLPLANAGKAIVDILPPPTRADEMPEPAANVRLPALGNWRDALSASPVVASDSACEGPRPLVVDGDRLYLHRLYEAECRLAARLTTLARRQLQPVPAALANRFGDVPEAAAKAALGGLCIVTGGPGTGKTTLAASLIAFLVAAGTAKPARIGLVAPTGKAAARLQEAVKARLDQGLRERAPALADFEPNASTMHRLLARSALPLDALIVDECSMVDLSLMTRVTDALPDNCRLILLGDAEQLSSVEPGSLFGDLCGVDDDSPLRPCIVRLTQSHRFDPAQGIGRLADAIVQGKVSASLATLHDESDGQTAARVLDGETAFERFAGECASEWRDHIAAFRQAPYETPPFPARRVLCANRRGPFGINRFNRLVERRLRDLGAIGDDDFFVGQPIIVTRNDRHVGLSNGDTGVVVDAKGPRQQVWFPELDGRGGRFLVSTSRLPQHESFFALTVHRAQGSEYDEVAFIPGDAASRVCTRELFYTAVTRARDRVTVFGTEAAIDAAITRTTVRASGLAERLTTGG